MEITTVLGFTVLLGGVVAYEVWQHLHRPIPEPTEETCTIKEFFSKSKNSPYNEITKLIEEANDSIDLAMYIITDTSIAKKLVVAHNRGVRVRIILDKGTTENAMKKNNNHYDSMKILFDSDIPILVNNYKGNGWGIMHVKMLIVDEDKLATGSYNYSILAKDGNEELLLIIKNHAVIKNCSNKFLEMWNDQINYKSGRVLMKWKKSA